MQVCGKKKKMKASRMMKLDEIVDILGGTVTPVSHFLFFFCCFFLSGEVR